MKYLMTILLAATAMLVTAPLNADTADVLQEIGMKEVTPLSSIPSVMPRSLLCVAIKNTEDDEFTFAERTQRIGFIDHDEWTMRLNGETLPIKSLYYAEMDGDSYIVLTVETGVFFFSTPDVDGIGYKVEFVSFDGEDFILLLK